MTGPFRTTFWGEGGIFCWACTISRVVLDCKCNHWVVLSHCVSKVCQGLMRGTFIGTSRTPMQVLVSGLWGASEKMEGPLRVLWVLFSWPGAVCFCSPRWPNPSVHFFARLNSSSVGCSDMSDVKMDRLLQWLVYSYCEGCPLPCFNCGFHNSKAHITLHSNAESVFYKDRILPKIGNSTCPPRFFMTMIPLQQSSQTSFSI